MKKLILSVFAVCLAFGLTAQVFSVGPRAGVNFANVSDIDDSESITGLVAGITGTYSINENSGLTLDILYSGEGWELDGSEVEISYLQIPLYYDIFFGDYGDAFRPKVYAGPAIGFLLNAEVDDVDISDNLNGVVISLSGGLGFNYRLAPRLWLNVDGRAFIGLSEIAEDPLFNQSPKARNVQLSLGLAYGILSDM